ncbi:MAG: hypothetical protein HY885_17810 [Deltaproteobacteria bacterium]|nr:hypothetical protein [Deltaproteobacteria bacterium]
MEKGIDRGLIPALREGIDVVKMVFFQELKEYLRKQYPGEGPTYTGMLAGAMMNSLFGPPNPQEKFRVFAEENEELIRQELQKVSYEFNELCFLLTDALRMHFLCNHQEGIQDRNEEILKNAREYGILIEEREVPLPKGFMEFVYRVGKARGFIVEQKK